MALHTYRIDFFQLDLAPSVSFQSPRDGLEAIRNQTLVAIHPTGPNVGPNEFVRDIWQLDRRRNRSFTGQFRKFRMSDLPEVGRAGQPAAQLSLPRNSGIVERNFFIYYERFQLVGWVNNGHANTAMQFARFLSTLWGATVRANPVLQPDAVRRLLRGGVEIKRMTVTIPRPANPDAYPNDDFSRETIEMLNRSGADSMHLMLTTDARRGDTAGHLANRMKRTLSELAAFGATTAKAVVFDDGMEHPIDLIADRISSSQEIEHDDGRYPPAASMYQLIDAARQESDDALIEYFGELDIPQP